MRLTRFKTKIISVTLVFILMLQSCSVYKKTPVTIDEAAKSNSRILIRRTDDTKLKLKRIENVDGAYFGVKRIDGKIVSLPLDEKNLKSIRVLDKTKTTLGNVSIVVLTLGVILIFIAASTIDNSSYDLGPVKK